jgi:SWIM zinc finger
MGVTEGLPAGKIKKALRYSSRPDRVESIEVALSSDHELRRLFWSHGVWTCTCGLYQTDGKCSHVLTVSLWGLSPDITR